MSHGNYCSAILQCCTGCWTVQQRRCTNLGSGTLSLTTLVQGRTAATFYHIITTGSHILLLQVQRSYKYNRNDNAQIKLIKKGNFLES